MLCYVVRPSVTPSVHDIDHFCYMDRVTSNQCMQSSFYGAQTTTFCKKSVSKFDLDLNDSAQGCDGNSQQNK